MGDAKPEVFQPLDGTGRLPETVEGEVEVFAVRHGSQQIANRFRGISPLEQVAKRVIVAERFGHLLSIHQQVLAVDPIAGEWFSRESFRLGNLVFVVGKDQIGAPGMDIKGFAEVLGRHHGALDVPAGPSRPQLGFPVRLIRFGGLPQDKIPDIGFFIFVLIHPHTGPNPGQINLRELAVRGEFFDSKEDRAFAAIRESLFFQLPDGGHHVWDMVGGSDDDFRFLQAQLARVLEEGVNVFLRVLGQAQPGGPGVADRLIVHVGEVHHVAQCVAAPAQVAPQNVGEEKGPVIADVRVVVNRGAASIHAHAATLQWHKLFDSPG